MKPDLRFDFIPNRDDATLTIRREFNANRALVWDCYTKQALLEQWFAPKPMTTKTKSFDFRVGGHWIYAMVEPSGTEHWGRMDYQSITPLEGYEGLDAFSDAQGVPNPKLPRARWTVTFEDQGPRCLMQTVVRYDSAADLDKVIAMGMEAGLASTLERLDEVLEGLGTITIEATIDAPLERVWTCWTSPEHITQWNFATDDWCCPSAENDLRVGGRYRARMEAKDGSFGFDFEAVYDTVTPNEELVYTLEDGRRVQTTFTHEGGTTTVTTSFDPERDNPVEMQRGGWQAILDNFAKYVGTQG